MDEEQRLKHVYQLADDPKMKKQVDKLWAELDMDNENENLSNEGSKAMYKILAKHTTVFTDEEVKAGCTNWINMEIRRKDGAKPVCAKVRPLSNIQKENLKAQLDSLLHYI